jgi:hypothetical protein
MSAAIKGIAMRHGRKSEAGYSLMEITVVLAITTVVLIIAMNLIEGAASVSKFLESRNDLTTFAQRPLNAMQKDIIQARVIFGEDSIGTGYRQKVAAGLSIPVAPDSVLPVLDPTGSFSPDKDGVRTVGNSLLISKQLPPVPIDLPADGASFPALTFLADRYQFIYFYVTRDTSVKFATGDRIDNLAFSRSVEYADYNQLVNGTTTLSSAQKVALSAALRDTATVNLPIAWNPEMDVANSFYTIDTNLAFPNGSLLAAPTIAQSGSGIMIAGLKGGRIIGKMTYTVAYRKGTAKPGTAFQITNKAQPVPLYAEATANLPVDCGFEVKVIGPANSRQVLTRLVLYGQYGPEKYDSQQAFVITSFVR